MVSKGDLTYAGQAAYVKPVLNLYDVFVLGISNSFIWRCPSHHVLEHYNKHLSANHLDVGVGTGFFLDKATFPTAHPRLAIMDLNPNCLEKTAKRVARYQPQVIHHDVFAPYEKGIAAFDSIGVNYLIHCLPGSMATKEVIFNNMKQLLSPSGKLFGSTILYEGGDKSVLARGADGDL